ncbi:hypothetical protein HMPREF1580_00818 [Gardnerella vaginalis JCP8070]|nr:hypothetical protein HMPREF1580_00818 [Gardnerella vaginalis JCP8070]
MASKWQVVNIKYCDTPEVKRRFWLCLYITLTERVHSARA